MPAEEVKHSRLRKMQSLEMNDDLGRYRMKVLWSSRGDEPEMGVRKTFNSVGQEVLPQAEYKTEIISSSSKEIRRANYLIKGTF